MKNLNLVPGTIAAVLLVAHASAHANTVLENFESGNSTGWSVVGNWSVGGTTNTFPNVLPSTPDGGNFFARSGAPNVTSGALAETGVGSISRSFTVTSDTLSWQTIGWSGPTYDGASGYQILDANQNVKATFNTPQSDTWASASVNLLGLGFHGGDTFIFKAIDGKPAANYAWMGFDNVTLTGNTVAAVPEPETYALMVAGLGLVGLARRGNRRQSAP